MTKYTGSCLCGAVTYEVEGPLRPSVACHCSQCRRTSGHYWSATQVPDARLTLTRDDGLRWFRSSGTAERGFCGTCGASLFWRKDGEGMTSIGSGTLDAPDGLTTARHIHVSDKACYYEIEPGPDRID
ncbi:Glutathione-dependent formaldehyde-activating enzyme [Pseudoruegeria aquimaris]|uniref:Glutathione-dependent formaldehyde-activating enzyme n=1 Tax=Pseudoruegeria aquimaris TaxID=393663 RepID=A0A1Y5TRR4_9RHOB|nr:GFA family protein [Pseudoruegeria aquimaris]SLN68528.1 Glutathione-dependent formaldehyde-activating enzyme [Pseudoruegeria aquimaris]